MNELPSSGPLEFAKANIKLIDLVSKFFTREVQTAANDEDIIKYCKKYLKFLQDITEKVIPLLEGISEAFIPSELLLTLAHQTKELAKKLNFSEKLDIRLCPRWDFNYGIRAFKNFILSSLVDLPTPLFPELLEGLPSLPELFIFIRYPRTESQNILLHSLMTHELGHLVDFQTHISSTLLNSIKINKDSFEKLFKKECKREKFKPKKEQRDENQIREGLLTKCSEITEKWLNEFVCDLIATHLIGPAYFFALFEIGVLIGDIQKYSEGHPSIGLRLRFVSEELYHMYLNSNKKLEHQGVREFISKLHRDLKEIEEKNEFEPQNDGADYFKVVYLTILPNRPLLQETVRQKIKEFSYDVSKFNMDVVNLSDDIQHGIPPSEFPSLNTSKNIAASFASILNAGWLAYFFDMDKFYSLVAATENSDKLKARDNFNKLLFKGVESSFILQEWPEE